MRKFMIERPNPFFFIHFTLATLLIATMAAGMVLVSLYTPRLGSTAVAEAPSGGNLPQTLFDEAQTARTDMLVYAMEHGLAVEAESGIASMAFDDEWNLYTTDVVTAEGTVTLYAAVNKDEPRIRYTAAWDAVNGYATSWMPVLR